jgi:serine/threonine protein kinase
MEFSKLGPYRLGKKLGQGGMGAVYQGLEESTGKLAAIKVLSPHLASEEGFRVRFEAEIESLKKLRHPNIVRLYGYGEEGEYLFYAMELVDGTSLEEEIRAGRRFHWREVTDLAIKICKALKHAHDHGIVHRDIKPANLLLSTTGEIRLSDFGIARLFGNTRMTNDGGLLGTAEYMAPEQADGRPATERSDQYSLGGVMYALLAGRPPFRAAGLLEMLQLQRFAEPQSVRRYAPETPAELDRIIDQLLQKDPQKRFVNTLILARSLEAMVRGLSLSSQREDFVIPAEEVLPETGRNVDSLAPTLVPNGAPEPHEPADDADDYQLEVASTEQLRHKSLPAVEHREVSPVGRFTKVEDTVGDASAWDDLRAALGSWQTVIAAAGLLAIGLLTWHSVHGPTADQRFAEIEREAGRNQPPALIAIESKIRDFIERYPDDPRSEKVQALAQEVEDLHRQQRVDNESRRLDRADAHSAVERAYRDALNLKLVSPELAIRKFQALVDLYAADAQQAGWVRQARGELERLEQQLAEVVREDRRAVVEQLARAETLEPTDPAAAEEIRRAIITLYGDKPWLESLVDKAKRALVERPATTAGGGASSAEKPADSARGG